MRIKTYGTGGIVIRFESDEPILDAGFFPVFRIGDGAVPDFTVRVVRKKLPDLTDVRPHAGGHRCRVIAGGTACDYTFFSDSAVRDPIPYACAVKKGQNVSLFIDYNDVMWDTMIFDAVNLPELFLCSGAAIVHASFISVNGEGVLFAGPKQIGKSTQAQLWSEHRNAEIINGDRVVMRPTDGGATAYGVPFCGSSRICKNEYRPVRAVVFPEKSNENVVCSVSAIDAFKRLIGCVSYSQADPAARELALDITERIVSSCRCMRLGCLPDAGAVETLEKELNRII